MNESKPIFTKLLLGTFYCCRFAEESFFVDSLVHIPSVSLCHIVTSSPCFYRGAKENVEKENLEMWLTSLQASIGENIWLYVSRER
jgi:hypothetical protein